MYGMRRIVKGLSLWDAITVVALAQEALALKRTTTHPSVNVSAWFHPSCLPKTRAESVAQLSLNHVARRTLQGLDTSCWPCWSAPHAQTHIHAGRQRSGQPVRPPQAPSRPLHWALTRCGIDRPSVTVSRWITVSGRQQNKGGKKNRGGGGGGED